jgi:integrase
MKLTALNIETWKKSAARQEILDRDGLYFIVQPSGVKSWALRYRRKGDGKAVKHTIGSYPAISLKDARSAAIALRAEIERGADPHGAKVVARRRAAEVDDSFETIAKRYIAEYQFRRNRSWDWQARLLGLSPDPDAPVTKECPPLQVVKDGSTEARGHRRRLSLVDRWGERRIGDITDADIIAILDRISARAPIMANRVHAILHRLFDWARSKKLLAANPCVGIERPSPEQSRDRVLDDKELRAVWKATDAIGHPYSAIVKLLILTGQRRQEIAGLRWSEVDLGERVIHLPKERTKNATAHDVPLSAQALAVIAGPPRLVDVDLAFTSRRRPVNGFSKAKQRLDEACGVTDWTLHDIRRTVASGLQRLGVRLEVTEAVLNHKSGSVSGITAVYQRHDYAAEKRDALQRWADHVGALVGGRKENVVTLRGR